MTTENREEPKDIRNMIIYGISFALMVMGGIFFVENVFGIYPSHPVEEKVRTETWYDGYHQGLVDMKVALGRFPLCSQMGDTNCSQIGQTDCYYFVPPYSEDVSGQEPMFKVDLK